eukprot:403353719
MKVGKVEVERECTSTDGLFYETESYPRGESRGVQYIGVYPVSCYNGTYSDTVYYDEPDLVSYEIILNPVIPDFYTSVTIHSAEDIHEFQGTDQDMENCKLVSFYPTLKVLNQQLKISCQYNKSCSSKIADFSIDGCSDQSLGQIQYNISDVNMTLLTTQLQFPTWQQNKSISGGDSLVLNISQNNSNEVGFHLIKVQSALLIQPGIIYKYFEDVFFTLEIYDVCSQILTIKQLDNVTITADYYYVLGNSNLTIDTNLFVHQFIGYESVCQANSSKIDISYLDQNSETIDTSQFISNNETLKKLSVFTENATYINRYQINVTYSVLYKKLNKTISISFNLTILPQPTKYKITNTPPYFQTKPLDLTFCKFYNDFISISPSVKHIGAYKIQIFLVDSESSISKYEMTITVLIDPSTIPIDTADLNEDYNMAKKLKYQNGFLSAKIKTISNDAVVVIQFDKKMKIPKTFTKSMSQSLEVFQEKYDSVPLQINFTIQDFNQDQMYLKVYLINQYSISVSNKYFFVDSAFEYIIRDNYQISAYIPPQLDPSIQDVIDNLGLGASNSFTSFMTSNLLINIVMSQSLQYLWGMINGFQLISHMPLMAINIPASTQAFFQFVVEISSFQFINTDVIDDKIFEIDEFSLKPFNNYFDQMNFESTNVVKNLGFLLIMFIFAIIMIIFTMMLKLYQFHTPIMTKLKDFLERTFLFNFITRLFIEAQLPLTSQYQQNGLGDIDQAGGLIFILVSLIFPLVITVVSIQYCIKNKKKKKVFNPKFSTIIEGLKQRRLEKALIFIVLMMILNLVVQVSILILKPFDSPSRNYIELFNEICISVITYMFLMFTESFKLDSGIRINLGFLPLCMSVLYLVVNIAYILKNQFHDLKVMWKNYKIKRQLRLEKQRLQDLEKQRLQEELDLKEMSILKQNDSVKENTNLEVSNKSKNLPQQSKNQRKNTKITTQNSKIKRKQVKTKKGSNSVIFALNSPQNTLIQTKIKKQLQNQNETQTTQKYYEQMDYQQFFDNLGEKYQSRENFNKINWIYNADQIFPTDLSVFTDQNVSTHQNVFDESQNDDNHILDYGQDLPLQQRQSNLKQPQNNYDDLIDYQQAYNTLYNKQGQSPYQKYIKRTDVQAANDNTSDSILKKQIDKLFRYSDKKNCL